MVLSYYLGNLIPPKIKRLFKKTKNRGHQNPTTSQIVARIMADIAKLER